MFIRPELGGKVQDVYFSLHTVSIQHTLNGDIRLQRKKNGFSHSLRCFFIAVKIGLFLFSFIMTRSISSDS